MDEHKYNTRRTIVSFANTLGGFVIFGILDKRNSSNRQALDRIVGISDINEFGKRLTQKCLEKGLCIPIISFEGPQIIDYDGKNIAIIKIPQSEKRPHAILRAIDSPLEFWARGSGTARPMDYSYLLSEVDRSKEKRGWLNALWIDLEEMKALARVNVLIGESKDRFPNRFDSIICNDIGNILRVLAADLGLARLLLQLRHELIIANDFMRIFHSKLSLPLSNMPQIVSDNRNSMAQRSDSIEKSVKTLMEYLLENYATIRELLALNMQRSNKGSR